MLIELLKNRASLRLLLPGILCLLVACADELARGTAEAEDQITGRAFKYLITKGPIAGAECKLEIESSNQDGVKPLATLETSSDGWVDFASVKDIAKDIDSADVVSISCSGGTYRDEAAGEEKAGPALNSAMGMPADTTIDINTAVTPATEIAYQKYQKKKKAQGGNQDKTVDINAINAKVFKALGLSDGITADKTEPVDVTEAKNVNSNSPEGEYGIWLAMLSQLEKEGYLGKDIDEINDRLEQCIVEDPSTDAYKTDATCVANLKKSIDSMKKNTRLSRLNTDSIAANLDKVKSDGAALTITDLTTDQPADSFTYYSNAPASFEAIGTGMDRVDTVSINEDPCTNHGDATTDGTTDATTDKVGYTRLTGINCSNIVLPEKGEVRVIFTTHNNIRVDYVVPKVAKLSENEAGFTFETKTPDTEDTTTDQDGNRVFVFTKVYGDNDNRLTGRTATCGKGDEPDYTSDNPSAATVDVISGEVSIHMAGTTTITARCDGEVNIYAPGYARYILVVLPYKPDLSWDRTGDYEQFADTNEFGTPGKYAPFTFYTNKAKDNGTYACKIEPDITYAAKNVSEEIMRVTPIGEVELHIDATTDHTADIIASIAPVDGKCEGAEISYRIKVKGMPYNYPTFKPAWKQTYGDVFSAYDYTEDNSSGCKSGAKPSIFEASGLRVNNANGEITAALSGQVGIKIHCPEVKDPPQKPIRKWRKSSRDYTIDIVRATPILTLDISGVRHYPYDDTTDSNPVTATLGGLVLDDESVDLLNGDSIAMGTGTASITYSLGNDFSGDISIDAYSGAIKIMQPNRDLIGHTTDVIATFKPGISGAASYYKNVSKSYIIGFTVSPLPPELRDAAAIYSLRRLNPDYTGDAIRVRFGNGGEQNIGFTFAGELDEKELDGLGPPVRIMAWYDQSGNNRHITQITKEKQPTIVFYNGSVKIIQKHGNKPAISFSSDEHLYFDSSGDLFADTGQLAVFVAADAPAGIIGSPTTHTLLHMQNSQREDFFIFAFTREIDNELGLKGGYGSGYNKDVVSHQLDNRGYSDHSNDLERWYSTYSSTYTTINEGPQVLYVGAKAGTTEPGTTKHYGFGAVRTQKYPMMQEIIIYGDTQTQEAMHNYITKNSRPYWEGEAP